MDQFLQVPSHVLDFLVRWTLTWDYVLSHFFLLKFLWSEYFVKVTEKILVVFPKKERRENEIDG